MSFFKVVFVMVIPPLLYPFFEFVWTAKGVIPAEYLKLSETEAALRLGTLAGIPLTLHILAVSLLRSFSGAHNPLSGSEGTFLTMNKNALQNTLEQTVFFVINLWAAATWEKQIKAETLILITAVFIGCRLLFWFAYFVKLTTGFGYLQSFCFMLSMLNSFILLAFNLRNLYLLLS